MTSELIIKVADEVIAGKLDNIVVPARMVGNPHKDLEIP